MESGPATKRASTSDTAWASATERLPQWAAAVFPKAARIERVEIYWGRGRMPESSRSVVIQGWAEGAWITIGTARIPEPEAKTVLSFESVQVKAVRIWQDADGGTESTPGRMHIAQLEAYGASALEMPLVLRPYAGNANARRIPHAPGRS